MALYTFNAWPEGFLKRFSITTAAMRKCCIWLIRYVYINSFFVFLCSQQLVRNPDNRESLTTPPAPSSAHSTTHSSTTSALLELGESFRTQRIRLTPLQHHRTVGHARGYDDETSPWSPYQRSLQWHVASRHRMSTVTSSAAPHPEQNLIRLFQE